MRVLSFLLTLTCLLSACTGPLAPAPTPVPTATPYPTPQSLFTSSGGGEPRTPGYWLLWNSCAPGNQAETARANGGRAAGWVLMDDVLQEPGVLLGNLEITSCAQGVNLLRQQAISGEDRSGDPAYNLAGQLLASQLSLAVGAESCPAAEKAVQVGQLLLLSVGFDANGDYLGSNSRPEDVRAAQTLADQLARYNAGSLCIP